MLIRASHRKMKDSLIIPSESMLQIREAGLLDIVWHNFTPKTIYIKVVKSKRKKRSV